MDLKNPILVIFLIILIITLIWILYSNTINQNTTSIVNLNNNSSMIDVALPFSPRSAY
jgi:hypothetical protein